MPVPPIDTNMVVLAIGAGWYAGPAEIERIAKTMVFPTDNGFYNLRFLNLFSTCFSYERSEIAIIIVEDGGKPMRYAADMSGKSPCRVKTC